MAATKYKAHRAPRIQLTISLKMMILILICNNSNSKMFRSLTILTKSLSTTTFFLLLNRKGTEMKIFCRTDSLLAMRNKKASIRSRSKRFLKLKCNRYEQQALLQRQQGMNKNCTKENHAMMLKRSKLKISCLKTIA